jgi:hypothetical protein
MLAQSALGASVGLDHRSQLAGREDGLNSPGVKQKTNSRAQTLPHALG